MQTILIWAQDQQATHAIQMLQQSYRLILNPRALNLSSQVLLGARRTKPSKSVTKIQTPCITLYKDAHNFTNMQVVGEKTNYAKLYDKLLLFRCSSYFFPLAVLPVLPRNFTPRTRSSFAMIC